MQAKFSVPLSEAKNFAGVWKYHGLTIPLEDAHYQFATDFANVALNNFIELCARSATSRVPLSSPEGNAAMSEVSKAHP